jgi:hypothetical protein
LTQLIIFLSRSNEKLWKDAISLKKITKRLKEGKKGDLKIDRLS